LAQRLDDDGEKYRGLSNLMFMKRSQLQQAQRLESLSYNWPQIIPPAKKDKKYDLSRWFEQDSSENTMNIYRLTQLVRLKLHFRSEGTSSTTPHRPILS
jgi:hypothetical protein